MKKNHKKELLFALLICALGMTSCEKQEDAVEVVQVLKTEVPELPQDKNILKFISISFDVAKEQIKYDPLTQRFSFNNITIPKDTVVQFYNISNEYKSLYEN